MMPPFRPNFMQVPYGNYSYPMPSNAQYMTPHGNYGVESQSKPYVRVGVYDNYFQPAKLEIPVGTIVEWDNYGTHAPSITSDTDAWDTLRLASGERSNLAFTRAGQYPYHCAFNSAEMKGVIVVK
jgi:plastocyanin